MKLIRATSGQLRGMLRRVEQLGLSHAAAQKLRWFLYVLEHEGNVSLACRHFGIARSTFVRWARRFDVSTPESLEEQSRRPHHVRTADEDVRVVECIRSYRVQFPTMSKEKIRECLQREHGCDLSSSSIGRIIERHGFFFADTPSHRSKREMKGQSALPQMNREPKPTMQISGMWGLGMDIPFVSNT